MNGQQALRIKGLEVARQHLAADMLLKQTYGHGTGKSFRGCSVGCMAHSAHPRNSTRRMVDKGIHAIVAKDYGYPEWLAFLQDTIFEGLPDGERNAWHVQLFEVLATLPDDYDWQTALHRVHVGILRVAYRTAGSAKDVVQRVIDLHERAGRGESVSGERWRSAESAAWSVAWPMSRSAAESAAESAAARSAESAAARSAEAAARSAEARSAAYQDIRDAVLTALAEPSP